MSILFRFSPIILALQGYCLYHARQNGQSSNWYFVIIFFPILGSIFYLYNQFYSEEKLWDIAEEVKGMVNKDYRVDKLLKEAKYADTITNKTKLGEEFFKRKQYHQAISLFESCLVGFNADDTGLIEKVMKAHYQLKNYDKVIDFGDRIKDTIVFKKGDVKVLYAWSLHHLGQSETAQIIFKSYDHQFSNFPHRIEYAKFLQAYGKLTEKYHLLDRMKDEIQHMEPREKKMKAAILREINGMLAKGEN